MATRKQYWLITYRCRQSGEAEADATYYMAVIDHSLVTWVEDQMKDGDKRDCVLINHVEITAAEYRRLEGNVL